MNLKEAGELDTHPNVRDKKVFMSSTQVHWNTAHEREYLTLIFLLSKLEAQMTEQYVAALRWQWLQRFGLYSRIWM